MLAPSSPQDQVPCSVWNEDAMTRLRSVIVACWALSVTTPAVAQTFTATGSMNYPRTSAQATLMQDGRVLVSGGTSASSSIPQAEIYDPTAGTWGLTGSNGTARQE